MIEILNVNPIRKGNLLGTMSVHIKPWHLTLHEVKVFEKGAAKWLNLPSKEETLASGDKKYTEMVTFDTEGDKKRFRDQVMRAFEQFLVSNPDFQPEDLIKEGDELPF